MRSLTGVAIVAALSMVSAPAAVAEGVDVSAFVRKDTFGDIRISPSGEYLAATVPLEDRTGLAVLRRSDGKRMAAFTLGKDRHVVGFVWVNDERVLMTIAEQMGQLDTPRLTGELIGINFDGTRIENLVGARVDDGGAATRIKPREKEDVAAYLEDDLPADDKFAVVTIMPFADDPYSKAERMDVYTGRRTTLASVPAIGARFTTDNDGVVRFALGRTKQNISQLYHRTGEDAEWQLLNDETKSGRIEFALGFSPDNRVAYLQAEQPTGPDAIIAYDPATGERKPLLRDDNVDPWLVLRQTGKHNAPIGVMLMDGKPRTMFFDEASDDARLYRSLEKAFEGQAVRVTSTTADGRYALIQTSMATNPGDYFVFDRTTRQAEHIISSRDWLLPDDMAPVEPVSLKARDGVTLHGYLTRPAGSEGQKLPTVMLPHGGPFGVADTWEFNDEAQLLAKAGYAVLQVNYRGSGGYGRAFHHSGAREWAGKMQDDVTDATRWVVSEGIADAGRICIYGASYGAYAALVGVAREPALYKCAAGYAGVYDLPLRHRNFSHASASRRLWADQWMGEVDTLAARSPIAMASNIKAPVFLAAGGEDPVTPIEHSRLMEAAIKGAGGSVETLYYPTEGHGFYDEKRKVAYYSQLLDFLARHIGGAKAAPVAAKGP